MRHSNRQYLSAVWVSALAACLTLGLAPAYAAPGETTVGGELLRGKGKTVSLGVDSDPLPVVRAKTWVVANADTGEILAAKGAHVLRAPASTLKILTALTVMPQLDPTTPIKAKKRAVNTYGSKVGLVRGRTYSANDLFHALLLPSANDAAIALAQGTGSLKSTLNQMNQVADSLGAFDTIAKNPSGLDSPGQVSSAYDLATIGRSALALPYLRDVVGKKKYKFSNKKKSKTVYNTNRMLLTNFRGTVGLKTGFTTNAGRTFIGAAERKGTTYIVSLMGIKEASADAAEKLLSWAFANGDSVTAVGVLGQNTLPVQSTASPIQRDIADPIIARGFSIQETRTATAGTSLDGLAIGWMLLFSAIIAFVLHGIRSALTQRKNRVGPTRKGKISLEG